MIGKDGIGPCGSGIGPRGCDFGDVRGERDDRRPGGRRDNDLCELAVAFVLGFVLGQCCGNNRRRGCGRD